jgi:small subunit ribosomal protein S13
MAEKKEKLQEEGLIRIGGTDIPGRMSVYAGLTRIKGISWTMSNAICKILSIPRNKKISELTEKEENEIFDLIKSEKLPAWILNRKKDPETGANKHLITTELDLQKEFDIRRLKKIKSYKGIRHMQGQPVRGQKTRSHFRRKGPSVGVKRGAKPAPAPAKK